MRRIESQIDTNAADFKANFAAMSERLKEFHARQHAARYERPQRDIERLARQNKLGVRERLELLLDPGTPFLEFSTLAACRDLAEALNAEVVLELTVPCERPVAEELEAAHGSIVNVTSIAVKQPVDGLILSNSVRAAVTGFARTLANEVARDGVTVSDEDTITITAEAGGEILLADLP